MRRFVFAIVLGFLLCDAAGADWLLFPEPCTSLLETLPDNSCPATCLRCTCGQPIVAGIAAHVARVESVLPTTEFVAPFAATAPPADIFHIPKPASLTL